MIIFYFVAEQKQGKGLLLCDTSTHFVRQLSHTGVCENKIDIGAVTVTSHAVSRGRLAALVARIIMYGWRASRVFVGIRSLFAFI